MISKQLFRQLFFFAIIGVLATGTHYVVALFVHEFLNVSIYLANLAGYGCAVTVSYCGHGKITFQQELRRGVFIKFAVMSITIFTLSEIILALLERQEEISHRLSLLVVVLVIPLISFVVSKLWVFRSSEDSGNVPVAGSR